MVPGTSSDPLPDLINIQLRERDDMALWARLEAAAADDLDEDPDSLTRPDVLRWAARELTAPDCDHLEEYKTDTGQGVVCLRCEGDDLRGQRAVEREAAGGRAL